jgi:GTP-binding protein Era
VNVGAYSSLAPGAEALLVSATRGDNLDVLLAKIIASLPLGPRYYPEDEITDQQVRFMAGELVREQLLLHLRDEVPHAVAVVVNEFKEREVTSVAQQPLGPSEVPVTLSGMTYIAATIYVEREAHKPIVLGHDGAMLKAIGPAARQEIEKLLGTRVYLDLWVKARPGWRMDEAELRRLGYERPRASRKKGGGRRNRR